VVQRWEFRRHAALRGLRREGIRPIAAIAECAPVSLTRYLVRRLATAVTLFGVVVAVFLMTRVLPGDPVSVKAGQYATPQAKEAIREVLGLDKPLPVQFVAYLGNVLRGAPIVVLRRCAWSRASA
jgi:hypothetical protein